MAAYRNTSPELEEEMRKSIQENPSGISPELMEYATNLFPNLKTAVLPQNYNELAQNENPLPEDYNQLAQEEALNQGPLPQDYNELAQEEANEQDNFSEPMRLEKTQQEIIDQQRKMSQAYPEPIPSTIQQNDPDQEEANQQDNFSEPLRSNFGLEKTPEEIEQQRLRQQELYPETIQGEKDPTTGNRKFAFNQLKKIIPKNSAVGQSIKKLEEEEEAPKFEMSPEIKEYGYNLFGLKDIAGDTQQNLPMVSEEESKTISEESPDEFKLRSVDEEVEDWLQTSERDYWNSQKNKNPATQEPIAPSQAQPQMQVAEQEPIAPSQAQLKQELPEEDRNIKDIVKKVREDEDRADFYKDLAKVRDAAMGVGIGRVIAGDYGMYDEMKKRAKRPVEDIILENEIKDNKAKNDPNSDISKLMRKTLEQVGIDMSSYNNVSYSQLEKIYPSLANTISTKIAADARREQQQLANQLREESRLDRMSEKQSQLQEKRLSELSKRTDNVLKSEEFKLYNNIGTTNALIDEAIDMWNKGDDSYKQTTQSAFMGFAKAAQQDSSVVRESDMRVLAGGVNYGSLGGILQKIRAKGLGADYSPEELKGFKEAVRVIRDVKRQDLQKRFNPILKRAADVEITPDYLLSPDFVSDIYSQGTKAEKDPLQQQLENIDAKLNANKSRLDMLRKKREE